MLLIIFTILLRDSSLEECVIMIIDDDPLFLFGFCTNLFIDTLFLEKILVIFDNTPGLSTTSNRR